MIRNVRAAREACARDAGRFRDGRRQDYAEGLREEHVH